MVQVFPSFLQPLFVLLVIGVAAAAVISLYGFVRGSPPLSAFQPLAAALCIYALLMIAGSVTSRERRLPFGTDLCFDDWCATVTSLQNAPASSGSRVVTANVRVSSIAKRVTQRGSDPRLYLIDAGGTWYSAAPSPSDPTLGAAIKPGESFTSRVHAAVPAQAEIVAVRIWEGGFIDPLVPFDEESPFHRKTFLVRDR